VPTGNLEDIVMQHEEFSLGFIERNTVRVEVHGGMCHIEFIPTMSCGPAKNGLGFEMQAHKPQKMYHRAGAGWIAGTGSITRDDAIRLRDMLNRYISYTENQL
jgi:hypothetical protein